MSFFFPEGFPVPAWQPVPMLQRAAEQHREAHPDEMARQRYITLRHLLDGAETLGEVIDRLGELTSELVNLHDEGWTMEGGVVGDGIVVTRPPEADESD